ncbi:DUF4355 domain-containing protein [Companilactobacillus allii]|uniref:Scaffolding protein n=1 Tax=Companilactobacillus allii TaxID=1847728 RepID=A0A1P8Q2M9_9LACO|nr:DUF4355 domain-containing protein [Companilactobacillus allii]APX72077.1 hypothetical protein BTM29_05645 [Companilactobacillus allii]USQ69170.1 DUF4355 domain-containing protein [Companilactobacillus allii]
MKSLLKAPLKLNLQFFAEGDGGTEGSQPAGNDNQVATEDEKETDGEDDPKDKEDEKKYTRADFRKMFAGQMNEFKSKELPDLLKEAEQRGAERAKMSDKEKADADKKQREDELNKREQALNQREALADTTTRLSNEGLPTSFAPMLNDLDADKRATNIDNFKKVFSEAVHTGVLDQTKGGKTPSAGDGATHEENSGAQFAEQANKQGQGTIKDDPWKLK